ncbi:tyrosine-type recombinase/integrase [Nocardioides panacis]|uniref:Tyrosine-type recombinase/integrase n=1 Tax=Nocardioides panacis TaxID=2849501 RepID=A0A975T2I2_9ACTN|nr:tyrosine-type recombinase/integrase [Nocardioides panacis]QWZ09678.1 tyrosine-type recombinase/integrase [Nocardioides panacis]
MSDLTDTVLARVSPKSLPTYRPGILLLAKEHGHRLLEEVRLPDLERLRDQTRYEVGLRKVEMARQRGRLLRSYDPDSYGRGAAENCVRALRFYFRYAVAAGHLTINPALDLTAPRRATAPERPLREHELVDIWRGALDGSADPELDALLLQFLRETAARREGCLNLCIDHLDLTNCLVTLTEKGGDTRELPLSRKLLTRLQAFAVSRGANRPGDAVFRYQRGTPLTRRRFNVIFDRVDRNCRWTEPLDVGAHWIRHTTLADIAAVADIRVAATYAGHSPDELGVIGRYTKVTFDDLVAAYERLFGPRD